MLGRVLDLMPTAVLLLATISPAFAYSQDAKTQIALQKTDAYLTSLTVQGSFRGSVLVGINGKVVFEKGYGFANQEWNAQNSPTTKFRIASLTKQFTGACVLLLQERGQLNVSDPVSKYVSDLPETWKPLTIHQLLTHTSGLPNYPGMPRVENELNRTGATPRELIAVAATKPLEFMPGTRLRYTNTGYLLLGMVIEKVSGLSYAAFLQKNIFTPLGMKDSGYDRAALILDQRASGYMVTNGNITNADFIDMSIPNASGSIYSTVGDMYRWNESLALPGKLLTEMSLKEMFAVYPETLLQGMHYGYGVVIAQKSGRQLYYHGGGVQGFETVIQRYPKERICIVVLENLDPTKPWDVADQIASDLFGSSKSNVQ
jgi:CubicO group peptidase (beta-lactamase class C family)